MIVYSIALVVSLDSPFGRPPSNLSPFSLCLTEVGKNNVIVHLMVRCHFGFSVGADFKRLDC